MERGIVTLVASTLLLVSCGSGSTAVEGRGMGSAHEADPPLRLGDEWDVIDVRPAAVRPGQKVALHFPQGSSRGVAFSMDQWDGSAWRQRFYLTSDGGGHGGEPSWWSIEDAEGRGWNDVGVGGSGPDRVIVPDTASTGNYRICTANALDKACGLLIIK